MTGTFKAMVVDETADNTFSRMIKNRSMDELPGGDVTISVQYSSLNYKDALSATGNRGVTKTYPHTPGIDAAGLILESNAPAFAPNTPVLVTGFDLGMNTAGGFGQLIRVPAGWVVPLPENLSLKESMMLGTAGLTAGLSVKKIIDHGILPEDGDILVSGATGGVGSLAAAILTKLGYTVCAISGKETSADFLKPLGVFNVISREEARKDADRPLLKTRWAGVVDTVGGDILSAAVKSTKLHGAVTCCGNAASFELPLNVYPFILRGVTLYGIDSQNTPISPRKKVWNLLAGDWKPPMLPDMITEISLDELSPKIDDILAGKVSGRYLVNLKR